MTDRELDRARTAHFEEMRAKGYGRVNGTYKKPPKKYEIRASELSCISMINSILAYQGAGMTDAEAVMQMEERNYYNYLADYVKTLGRNRVVALIQGQIDDIVCVKHNVYRDSEGLTYNSIIWRDEQ